MNFSGNKIGDTSGFLRGKTKKIKIDGSDPITGDVLVADSTTQATWRPPPVGVDLFTETANEITFSDPAHTLCVQGTAAADKFHVFDDSAQIVLNADTVGKTVSVKNLLTIGGGPDSVQIATPTQTSLFNDNSISIGKRSGENTQKNDCVALGVQAGREDQATQSIAIGREAGLQSLSDHSVAIGAKAARNTSGPNSITLNASNIALDSTTSGLFINPIASTTEGNPYLGYNTTTKEVGHFVPTDPTEGLWTHGQIGESVYITWDNVVDTGFRGKTHDVFIRAVAALPAGGTIYVGPGPYDITAPIVLPAEAFRIIGIGRSQLNFTAPGTIDLPLDNISLFIEKVRMIINTASDAVTVSGNQSTSLIFVRECQLFWLGTLASRLVHFLNTGSIRAFFIHDCIVDSSGTTGNGMTFNSDVNNLFNISNCRFTGRVQGATYVNMAGDFDRPHIITNCIFEWIAFKVDEQNRNIQVSNSTFLDCHWIPMTAAPSPTKRIAFNNCYFHNPNQALDYILTGAGATGEEIRIYTTGCHFESSRAAFYLRGATGTQTCVIVSLGNLVDTRVKTIGQFLQSNENVIEWPRADRTLASLSTTDVGINTTAFTNDQGAVRWTGVWTPEVKQYLTQTIVQNNSVWTQNSYSGSVNFTVKMARSGDIVTLAFNLIGGTLAFALSSYIDIIPLDYRPSVNLTCPVWVDANAVNTIGWVEIKTDGQIRLKPLVSAGQPQTIFPNAYSYTAA